MKQRLVPLVLALSFFALGACAEDADPSANGGEQPTSTGGGSTPPTSPSAPASPTLTVEPASGVRLELSAISAHAPRGWARDGGATDYQVSASRPDIVTLLFLLEVPDPTNGAGGLEEAAKQSLQASAYLQKPKILEPTEIDGVEVYHIAGRIDSSSFLEEFGTSIDGQAVRIKLQMTEIMSEKERRELVESVLQTVELG